MLPRSRCAAVARLLLLLGLASGTRAGTQDDRDLQRLRDWFQRYRSGHIDASVIGRLIPELQPPPAFPSLERALARVAGEVTAERVETLIEIAAFRFHEDKARELELSADRQPWVVRARARRQLADYASIPGGAALMAAHASAVEPEHRAIAVQALGIGHRALPTQAARVAVLQALRDDAPGVRTLATEAAAAVLAPNEAETMIPLLSDERSEVRIRALATLQELLQVAAAAGGGPQVPGAAVAAAGRLLHDGDPFVRMRAAELASRHPEHVERDDLIRALAEEAVRREAGGGRDRFLLPLIEAGLRARLSGEELRRFRPLQQWTDLEAVAKRTKAGHQQFFGEELQTDHVVFVIDVSGSMRRPAGQLPDLDGFEGREEKSRMTLARRQLHDFVTGLDERQRFNLVQFAEGARELFDDLEQASESVRNRAISFIYTGTLAQGKTDLFAGILKGLQVAGLDAGDRFGTTADTLVVLTDGIPTTGAITDPEDIRELLTELNRGTGIRIHVVDLGRRHAAFARSLQKLAEANGGSYLRMPAR